MTTNALLPINQLPLYVHLIQYNMYFVLQILPRLVSCFKVLLIRWGVGKRPIRRVSPPNAELWQSIVKLGSGRINPGFPLFFPVEMNQPNGWMVKVRGGGLSKGFTITARYTLGSNFFVLNGMQYPSKRFLASAVKTDSEPSSSWSALSSLQSCNNIPE